MEETNIIIIVVVDVVIIIICIIIICSCNTLWMCTLLDFGNKTQTNMTAGNLFICTRLTNKMF